MRHLPNILTFLRILMVAPLAWALMSYEMKLACWLFILAGFTDLLDGYIARRFKLKSALGAFLDPLADKVLMVTSYVLLAYLGIIPLFLTALVLTREAGMIIGLILYYRWLGVPKFKANFVSKVNTVLEGLLILDALLEAAAYIVLPSWVRMILIAGVVITIFWSYWLYFCQGMRDLRQRCPKVVLNEK